MIVAPTSWSGNRNHSAARHIAAFKDVDTENCSTFLWHRMCAKTVQPLGESGMKHGNYLSMMNLRLGQEGGIRPICLGSTFQQIVQGVILLPQMLAGIEVSVGILWNQDSPAESAKNLKKKTKFCSRRKDYVLRVATIELRTVVDALLRNSVTPYFSAATAT